MNSSNPFPQSSGDRTIVRAIENDDNKRTASFRNNSTDALNSKNTVAESRGPAQVQSNQHPSMEIVK